MGRFCPLPESTRIPTFIHVSDEKMHDVNVLDILAPEPGAFYVMDRGYVDFEWIKQHLRIKSFFGTSENAVKTQIWIAVTVYVLVAVLRKRLGISADLYTIL